MSKSFPYIEKELSWLSFNERVLQEAADKTVPVIERARFLGIFSNNMDEFFRVRVADVRRRIVIGSQSGDANAARETLTKIHNKVLELQEEFDEIYSEVLKALARHRIYLVEEHELTDDQIAWLRRYFKDKLLRYIAPIIISDDTDLSHVLKDDLTYLITEMHFAGDVRYAAIEIPTDEASRFVSLPKIKGVKRKDFILLDNIIRVCIDEIYRPFFEYDSCASYSMKMTRDAEYGLADDIDQSLVEQMSEGLKQRLTAKPVRFVHDREMPRAMIEMVGRRLGMSNIDTVVPGGRYHNFRDFMSFPNPGRDYLEHEKISALNCHAFESAPNIFEAIRKQDILLHYPYYKFRYFTEFLRQAAFDPQVVDIKICVYRLAKRSRIVKSLIDAVENGKSVTVHIELAARFDEEANIEWAKALTDANVKVEFGIAGLKTHSKICLITRHGIDGGGRESFACIGTGNFNEKTAKTYTDYALFTADERLTHEVADVFQFIEHSYRDYQFQHLLVSPKNTRNILIDLIDREVEKSNKGKVGQISLKVNNLDDPQTIKKLYEASQAGVKIHIIVRGICSLVPGVKGASENIQVISIIDRYLEHPRVFIFGKDKKDKPAQVYIASCDLMVRNLDLRVEVSVPIYSDKLRKRIIDNFDLQWSDTTKARVINEAQSNPYKPRGNKRKIRSQMITYSNYKKLESKASG